MYLLYRKAVIASGTIRGLNASSKYAMLCLALSSAALLLLCGVTESNPGIPSKEKRQTVDWYDWLHVLA